MFADLVLSMTVYLRGRLRKDASSSTSSSLQRPEEIQRNGDEAVQVRMSRTFRFMPAGFVRSPSEVCIRVLTEV